MDHEELRVWSKRAADWAANYHAGLRERPVRARVKPGEVRSALPSAPPETPEPMESIWEDFERLVPGAMTHWQHPRFFAYFPSNAAPVSMLAEQLANAISAMCMLWQTSPAATEIEQVMVDWMRQALGLAPHFTGTIHDSATTATLSAILTMRDRATGWDSVENGLAGGGRLRIYASAQTHSSVDKAVRLAGIGQANLVKIATDATHAMVPAALDEAIRADRRAGHIPAGVVLCTGGTSIGACDPIAACIAVAREHGLYTHLDAAWAGNAMICPEFRALWHGADGADSIVVNPYKWLGAQFDGSIQFLADPAPQIRSLGLRPDYLETLDQTEIVNFNEWTVPLGRRFRALKLWFLLRSEGLEGLRARIRAHVSWTAEAAAALATLSGVEIVTPPKLALFSFALSAGDDATESMLVRLNAGGQVYLTQTRVDGRFVIRVAVGVWSTTREDVMSLPRLVAEAL